MSRVIAAAATCASCGEYTCANARRRLRHSRAAAAAIVAAPTDVVATSTLARFLSPSPVVYNRRRRRRRRRHSARGIEAQMRASYKPKDVRALVDEDSRNER